jgi:DNA-binding winged helix-turn-helix (wHTH) protein
MTINICPTPSPRRRNPLPHGVSWSRRASTAGADFEFGRLRVLLRRRQLLTDGVPVELGTRGFDLLLALLEADGSLAAKEELMRRVWPGIVVAEENLRVQVAALRKALGADRDLIRTEFGRSYRFTGALRSNASPASECLARSKPRSARILFRQACLRSFRSVNSAACAEPRRFSGLDTEGDRR